MAPVSVSSDDWRRVCGRLERELDTELLDGPLDALDPARIGAEAAELLAHCHAAGVAARLRDLVRWEPFVAWVEETCTEREGQRLAAALAGLLGGSREVGPDDPARLVAVDPPPLRADALRAWAERHGIGHELPRPAHEVLTLRGERSELTLFACLVDGAESRDPWGAQELAAQAERHLLREARRAAALPAREALWREPAPSALRGLVSACARCSTAPRRTRSRASSSTLAARCWCTPTAACAKGSSWRMTRHRDRWR